MHLTIDRVNFRYCHFELARQSRMEYYTVFANTVKQSHMENIYH